MFGDRCARCFVKKDKVRLFDVIYEGKSDFLCERCAIIENISLIIKPGQNQLNEAGRPPSVYDRMKKLSGIPDAERNKLQSLDWRRKAFVSPVSPSPKQTPHFSVEYKSEGLGDEQKQGEDLRLERLNELESNPGLMEPVKEKPDMVEHFNWIILRERRKKGLTQERLAEAVGIPVEYVDLLEKGNIPNNIRILEKLENFFKVKLMKQSPFREGAMVHPVLLDEYGNVLDHIPEPDVEIMFSADEYTNDLIKKEDSEDFDIHKADLAKVSLKDLMELHRKKILISEEEKIGQDKFEENFAKFKKTTKFSVEPFEISKMLENSIFDYDQELRTKNKVLDDSLNSDNLANYSKLSEESQKANISNPVASSSIVIKKVSGIDKNRLAETRKEELRLLKEKQSQELDSLLGGSELLGGKEDKENRVDRLFDEALG